MSADKHRHYQSFTTEAPVRKKHQNIIARMIQSVVAIMFLISSTAAFGAPTKQEALNAMRKAAAFMANMEKLAVYVQNIKR